LVLLQSYSDIVAFKAYLAASISEKWSTESSMK